MYSPNGTSIVDESIRGEIAKSLRPGALPSTPPRSIAAETRVTSCMAILECKSLPDTSKQGRDGTPFALVRVTLWAILGSRAESSGRHTKGMFYRTRQWTTAFQPGWDKDLKGKRATYSQKEALYYAKVISKVIVAVVIGIDQTRIDIVDRKIGLVIQKGCLFVWAVGDRSDHVLYH